MHASAYRPVPNCHLACPALHATKHQSPYSGAIARDNRMAPIDEVRLAFNPHTLTLLNAVLGLVMFGVALELRVEDFLKIALRTPKARWPWACWATTSRSQP